MDVYLHHAGTTTGPFDTRALRDRVHAGDVPAHALSWRAGEPRWISLARRWQAPAAARRQRIAAVLAAACAPLAIGLLLAEPHLPWAMRSAGPLAAACGVLLLVGLIATIALARGTRRLVGRVTAGPLYAAYALALVGLILAAGFTQRWRMEHAPDAAPPARFALSADGRRLDIDGDIGRTFVDDLAAQLARAPRLERVVIRSEGGYVDPAVEAGERLRARGIAVRVREVCASACVLVWSRATLREIEAAARIGLHRTRVDASAPGGWKRDWAAASDAQMIGALRRDGFSEALLERAATTGPDGMAWVDAATLQDEGLEVRIVDAAGNAVQPQHARMAAVIAAIDPEAPTHAMLVALRDRMPELLEPHAADLRATLDAPDEHDITRATMAVGAAMRVAASERAPDAAVVAWGRRVQSLFADAARAGTEADCRILMGEAPPPPETVLQARLAEGYAALFAAVPANGEGASRRGDSAALRDAMRAAYLDALRQGRDGPPTAWPARAQCGFLRDVYAHAVRQPAPRAARAILALDRLGRF